VRDRSADSNVVDLPRADRIRLDEAIRAFDSGDQTARLLEEFQLLANRGYREANYFLGCIYEDGSNGATRDLKAALRAYQGSIDGFGYVEGYLAVARFNYYGNAPKVDYGEAFRLYQHVAERHAHPVAYLMLGRMYQQGQGVTKDTSAARIWLTKAASLGSVYGMLDLAILEREECHYIRHLRLRVMASVKAFTIARKNPKDIRLRPG
jgi:TPR repeat protein